MEQSETLYNKPPMVNSPLDPEDIIGDNMEMIVAHFTESMKYKDNPDGFDAGMRKAFQQDVRDSCSKIYRELRINGYQPHRVKNNRLVCTVTTRHPKSNGLTVGEMRRLVVGIDGDER